MKNYIIGIALALALVMGVVAFAETAETATDPVPAVTEEAPAEEAATDDYLGFITNLPRTAKDLEKGE